jgi:ABC-2 type transport system ATP-binding protein
MTALRDDQARITGDAVQFEQLTVRRGGREVLHGLNGAFGAGRVTGLFGPSGSGTSTLIHAVAGVQAGVQGALRLLGLSPGACPSGARSAT